MRTIEAKAIISAAFNAAGFNAARKALGDLSTQAQKLQAPPRARGAMGWGEAFQRDLDRLKLSARDVDRLRQGWERLHATMGARVKAGSYFDATSAWKDRVLSDLRQVRSGYDETSRARSRFFRDAARFSIAAGGVGSGPYVANKTVRAGLRTAADMQQETSRQAAVNMSVAEQGDSIALSGKLSRQFPSESPTSLREHYRMLWVNFGRRSESIPSALEDVTRSKVLLRNFRPGEQAQEDLAKIIKGAENAGFSDRPAKFRNYIEGATKGMQLFGDTLRGEDFYQYAKVGRTAISGLGSEYLGAVAPSILDDMGGPSAGQAHYSAFNTIVGGRISKKSKAELRKLGLIGKDGRVIGRDVFTESPFRWATEVLKPQLEKRGIKVDQENLQPLLDRMTPAFENRNTADFILKHLTKEDEVRKNQESLKGVKGLDWAEQVRNNNPYVALEGTIAQFNTLFGTMATALMPAVGYLNAFNDALGRTSALAAEHPLLAAGAGAGAAAVTVGGTAWLVKQIAGGFGLHGSALALNTSAAALTAAASALGGGAAATTAGAVAGGAAAGGTAAGASSWLTRLGAGGRLLGGAGIVAGVGLSIWDLYQENQKNEGLTANERLRKARGGLSMRDTYRQAFDPDRARFGLPLTQGWRREDEDFARNPRSPITPSVSEQQLDRLQAKVREADTLLQQAIGARAAFEQKIAQTVWPSTQPPLPATARPSAARAWRGSSPANIIVPMPCPVPGRATGVDTDPAKVPILRPTVPGAAATDVRSIVLPTVTITAPKAIEPAAAERRMLEKGNKPAPASPPDMEKRRRELEQSPLLQFRRARGLPPLDADGEAARPQLARPLFRPPARPLRTPAPASDHETADQRRQPTIATAAPRPIIPRTMPSAEDPGRKLLEERIAVMERKLQVTEGRRGTFGRARELLHLEGRERDIEGQLESRGYGLPTIANRGIRSFSLQEVREAIYGAGGAPGAQTMGGGPVTAELRGSAEVKGETTVRVVVEPSGELLRVVNQAKDARAPLAGRLHSDGPGSVGRSMPEAAAGGGGNTVF